MIKRTLHHLWSKKFAILILALILILLPNTIGHGMQVCTTTVITEMTIERNGNQIQITAQKFQPTAGSEQITYETVVYQGTDLQQMLAQVSLAHCTKIEFTGQLDLELLHQLNHFQNLRGNTKVNGDKTINELLRNYDAGLH